MKIIFKLLLYEPLPIRAKNINDTCIVVSGPENHVYKFTYARVNTELLEEYKGDPRVWAPFPEIKKL